MGFATPEQLSTGTIEIRSAAEHPLYLPSSWAIAKVLDCQFTPYGPPRFAPRPRRVPVNSVTTGGAVEVPLPLHDRRLGSAAADEGPIRKGQESSLQVDEGNSQSRRTSRTESSPDILDMRSPGASERAPTPDRSPRPPRLWPASPDPDGTLAPAAAIPRTYRTTEDRHFVPVLPSTNSCLTPEELAELRELLHEFRDRFNDGTRPLAATNLLKARLDTGGMPPISCPPRRLSPKMRAIVRSAVADLEAQGIAEPGEGQYGSPVVMVQNASGAWILCCDYREANKHVAIPRQPVPRPDDILASFKGNRYFLVMEMCHGFYQIKIVEEEPHKTSFVTPDCQRQYRRLPFGFASSPAIFQRMVDMLLGGMKWVFAIGYIDDIIVYSDTWVDHLSHLRQLFVALQKADLELHRGKCAFGAQEVKYLGHLVTRVGIRACPSKIKAVVEMPKPVCAKEVQRFVGKCQHYRKFIPNFSQVAAPLFKAQTTRRDFVWTDACDPAWKHPREALISDAILVHPDYTRDFLLDCDASGEGLGAVLLQAHDGGEAVVAYASRSLLEHEKKWTATELEAAALIWALETFRPYIDGVHVTIHTDHAPLEYIRAKTDR